MGIVLRTRFFDDFLVGILQNEAVRQVVVVAAGLDTRGFRLNWPEGTCLFEVDQSSVLEYKEKILREAGAVACCDRRAVRADLTSTWADKLLEAGFRSAEPSLWLLESLFYIPNQDASRILDDVSRLSVPGSWLGLDVMNSAMLTSPWTQKWVQMQAESGAPWIGTMDDPVAALGQRGWNANLTQAGADDANHGRWPYPVIPIMMPGAPHNWFVTARK